MAIEHYFIARSAAGRAAVAIADEHDRDIAADMVRGYMVGFLLMAAHYDGWDDLLHRINEVVAEARGFPAQPGKPSLSVVGGKDAA